MDANRVKIIAVSLAAAAVLGAPAVGSAQGYRYTNDARPAVVVECGPGQRAVMEQRGTQLVARCLAARTTRVAPAARRSKTKTALMIGGSAATGAGVGGALKGKKGALVGAARGGGAARRKQGVKRR
jgi:hypothetical protein